MKKLTKDKKSKLELINNIAYLIYAMFVIGTVLFTNLTFKDMYIKILYLILFIWTGLSMIRSTIGIYKSNKNIRRIDAEIQEILDRIRRDQYERGLNNPDEN